MSITAILDAGTLQGKIKLTRLQSTIDVILTLPLKFTSYKEHPVTDTDTNYKLARFEWRERLGKYTHRYTLKEII